jgi:CTP synthase
MQTKYVVILGSVMSGLGKGVVTSSILKLLDFYNYSALPVKFDGYLNYDCGTMNPYRHGEVFVLDDKSEVDMDFGLYERFLNKNMQGNQSITGGKLFGSIIEKERRGGYLGEDVQIIPHLTSRAIEMIQNVGRENNLDVVVVEVGGTVGDLENSYFIEAMRQLALKEPTVFINLTYTPKMEVVGEQKTKPAQQGFRNLLQSGIMPDFVVCRSVDRLLEKTKEKLALFANITKERVIDDSDLASVYMLPLHFMEQGFDKMLMEQLGFGNSINSEKLDMWKNKINNILNPSAKVEIGVLGKYTGLSDSYASIKEAVAHAGAELAIKPTMRWIEGEDLEKGDMSKLDGIGALIVPGGFGKRGIEGMIKGIQYAREKGIPYLGICLGMQLMCVEYARNVCGLEDANSSEFDPNTKHDVISLMDEQKSVKDKGGTMRLGLWECKLKSGTTAYALYGREKIGERHRHRYEFNNNYRELMEEKGFVISGTTMDNKLVEFVEWKNGFGIATQSHPELRSRLEAPAPLFVGLLKSANTSKTANTARD